ncbi:hypothetical protein AOQ71_12345 [Bradyrhizobium manausense]|uniref:CHAT domain-containing protein n=2 Tax=Bradyrhizobium manausense TaxID=989370 RepID=A0A0R3E2M4_9BRAD|nr:hypothetical protein AOQ71_12345 [Bradyrhizobium manausense]
MLYWSQRRFESAEPLFLRSLAIREKRSEGNQQEVAIALKSLADDYSQLNRHVDAEPLYRRALIIYEKLSKPESLDLAVALRGLANSYRWLDRAVDAAPLHERALAIREKISNPDDSTFAVALKDLADDYWQLNRYADATPLHERALAIRERISKPDDPDLAVALKDLADDYWQLNRNADAEPLHKRALIIREKISKPNDSALAVALKDLADDYWQLDRYANAEPLHKRALVIREKISKPSDPELAVALKDLGDDYYQLDRYEDAELFHKRALAVREKSSKPDDPELAVALKDLGDDYYQLDRYADAEPLHKRALVVREKISKPGDAELAVALKDLGDDYYQLDRYADAEPLHKRALVIREKNDGPADTSLADALDDLASDYNQLGRYADALALSKRELALLEHNAKSEDSKIGHALKAIGDAYTELGKYTEAESFLLRALHIFDSGGGTETDDLATVLDLLGWLYQLEDRSSDAEPLMERALRIRETIPGNDPEGVSASLNDLAFTYERERKFAEAEPLYKRSIAIDEKLNPNSKNLAISLKNLGRMYESQRRYKEAESLLRRSLQMTSSVLGPENEHAALVWNNLGSLYLDQDQYDKAEDCFQHELSIKTTILGAEHPLTADALENIGRVKFAQKDFNSALGYFRRAAAIEVSILRLEGNTIGNPVASDRGPDALVGNSTFERFIKVAHRINGNANGEASSLAEEAFMMAQRLTFSSTALSLSQMAARAASGSPELAKLVRERQDSVLEWQSLNRDLIGAAAGATASRKPEAEQRRYSRMTEISTRIAEIDSLLGRGFSEYSAFVHPQPLSVQNAQKLLKENEAIVAILPTDRSEGEAETFVWAITKTQFTWIRIGSDKSDLRRDVGALRCGLDESNWVDASGWPEDNNFEKERKAAQEQKKAQCQLLLGQGIMEGSLPPFDLARARQLYVTLFGQIEELIRNKSLIIVPSPPLTVLPFAVLVTEEPRRRYPPSDADYRDAAWLIRDHALSVLPSIASLAALRARTNETIADQPYIAFGNPLLVGSPDKPTDVQRADLARRWQHCEDFEELPRETVYADKSLSVSSADYGVFRGAYSNLINRSAIRAQAPLPETARELCAVGREMGLDHENLDRAVYLGGRATETTIKNLNEKHELEQYRVVQFATHGVLAGAWRGLAEPGLILTPPAENTDHSDDDGYLSASEIAALQLNAEWVVLSACNTAAGANGNAEALSGLAKAFFYARARAILVSHWAVKSSAAVSLTTKAFGELRTAPAIGRAEALRRSMIAMIDDETQPGTSHPSVWAPFILVGEGSP